MHSSADHVGTHARRRLTYRRSERLTRQADFRDLVTNGAKHNTQYLLFCCRENGLTIPRFGVASPKKLGVAPVRNRCRRRIRELIRTNKERMPAGKDILVIIRKDISKVAFVALRESFLKEIGQL